MNFETAQALKDAARHECYAAFVVPLCIGSAGTDYGVSFENRDYSVDYVTGDERRARDYISRNSLTRHI